MRIRAKAFTTLPTKEDEFWQIVVIPTISVLNSINRDDRYIAVSFEWIFWSFTFIFSKI